MKPSLSTASRSWVRSELDRIFTIPEIEPPKVKLPGPSFGLRVAFFKIALSNRLGEWPWHIRTAIRAACEAYCLWAIGDFLLG